MKIHESLDLSGKRNVYAIGDIHGRFNEVDKLLEEIHFDKELDFLISVGDLVDRGDANERCVMYIGQPWFKHIIGNHEVMAEQHLQGESYIHTINGGGWLAELEPDIQKNIVSKLMDTCIILDVKTPSGLHCGFIHADVMFSNWQDNIDNAAQIEQALLWSRTTVKNMRNPSYDPSIAGIDKVFFGHNAMYKPVHRGNCYWIDTGSGFSDGVLTIINVDTDKFYTEKK